MTEPRQIDWLRLAHRGFALVRALRGDANLDDDHQRERNRAAQVRKTIDDTARAVVGCVAHKGQPCDCPVCSEEPTP